jgi:decaprenylphospho-beta-D-erythro-pentofuranosid-2-ulose 2-reductase
MRDALGSVQSVLVLGGGSDIAQATVRRLVSDRATTVVLGARRPEELKGFADELAPAHVEAVAFDARDTSTHQSILDEIWSRHADIDVVLIAFGVLGDHDQSARDSEAAVEVLETNLVGAASAAVIAAGHLRSQGHGTLVVLSSVAAERVRKSMFVYGASKAGLDGFCQGLADHLHGTGVDVMIVRPGFVHTKMTAGRAPAPLATTADAVADGIVAGLRKRTATVWVPAQLRWAGVVFRHLPRSVWRKIER